MKPQDPQGPISLLPYDRPLAMIVQVAGLSAGVAAVAAVVGPARLSSFGVFAVAFGLAVANTRGAKMDYLLANLGGSALEGRGRLCATLALAVLIWFLPIVAAFLVERLVRGWLGDRPDAADGGGREQSSPRSGGKAARTPAGRAPGGTQVSAHQELASGLTATGICAVTAFVVIGLTATGSPVAAIEKGQVYFSLAAGFFLGGLLAHHLCTTQLTFWYYLSVPPVAVVGYLLAWLFPRVSGFSQAALKYYDALAHIPPNAFARALPIEYVAVGTAAALAGCWSSQRFHRSRRERESE